MHLVNLRELIKYHPYHICTFADFANVTTELLEAAIKGTEKIYPDELSGIAKYSGVPLGVLMCPKLIILDNKRRRHREMVKKLDAKLYPILEAEKTGSKDAETFVRFWREELVNLSLDFINGRPVSYCRYLGIKEKVEQCLSFIKVEQQKQRKRGRQNATSKS